MASTQTQQRQTLLHSSGTHSNTAVTGSLTEQRQTFEKNSGRHPDTAATNTPTDPQQTLQHSSKQSNTAAQQPLQSIIAPDTLTNTMTADTRRQQLQTPYRSRDRHSTTAATGTKALAAEGTTVSAVIVPQYLPLLCYGFIRCSRRGLPLLS